MRAGGDRWMRWTTIGCVGLLALIAGTVSYLHMHTLVALHGQPGLGGGADATVRGRDDRRCVDHFAGGLASWPPRRSTAVDIAGGRQRGEPGRQRRGSRAHYGRPGDRGLAQLLPDRLV